MSTYSRSTNTKFTSAEIDAVFFRVKAKITIDISFYLNSKLNCCVLAKNIHSHIPVGHTLLAVRAPTGTQLDVPIPKAVSSAPLEPNIAYCFWFSFI